MFWKFKDMEEFFYKTSIKKGIFYPLLLLFVFGFFVSIGIIYFGGNYILKRGAYNELSAEKIRFLGLLKEKEKVLEQLVSVIAEDSLIKESILQNDKKFLWERILFITNFLKNTGQISSLSVEVFPNAEEELKTDKNIITGFEVVSKRINFIAIAPIYDFREGKKTFIGKVKLSLDIKDLINTIPFAPNQGIMIFLDVEAKKILKPKKSLEFEVPYISTSNLPLNLYSKFKKIAFSSEKWSMLNRYVLISFGLLDYQGKKIGRVVLFKNISSLVQQRNIALISLSFMFFVAFLFTLALIWKSIDEITQRLISLKESVINALKGDFSYRLPRFFKTKCWEVLGCEDKDCVIYGDSTKICFLVTGDLAFGSPYKETCHFLKKFGSCENCPVMKKTTKNELEDLVVWHTNFLGIMQRFFDKVVKNLTEKLYIVQEDPREWMIFKIEEVISELTQLRNFRKTLETFLEKQEIYNYLSWYFKIHFGLKNFIIYEVNNSENRFELVIEEKEDEIGKVPPDVLVDCNLCPVKRNGENLSSLEYPDICAYSNVDTNNFFYCCLPIMMGGHVGAVVKIVVKREEENIFLRKMSFIEKYLEETAPILEAKRAISVAKQQALRDQLTGLYNRRFMNEYLKKWKFILKRQQGKASILMIDLDHFKKVNDTYGHHAGDIVLKRVAAIITSNLRASDFVFRYGGEEILVFLTDVTKENGLKVAEKLREAIELEEFRVSNKSLKITVSIGVASYPEDSEDLEEVVKLADKALYAAKHKGRNCVVAYQPGIL